MSSISRKYTPYQHYSDAICCIWSLCIPTILPTALAVSLPCKHKIFKLAAQAWFSDCRHQLRTYTSNIRSWDMKEKIQSIIPTICYSKAIYLTQSSRRHSTHQCFNASLKIQQNNENITRCGNKLGCDTIVHAIIAKPKHILLSNGKRKTYKKWLFEILEEIIFFLSKLSLKKFGSVFQ